MNTLSRSQWSSSFSYILVMIGAVVGLGNIIQFPYFVTQYGGLFVGLYILCELAISLPLLFAELMIGRTGRQNPVGAIGIVVLDSGANYHWRWIGWLSVIVAFFTLAYYLVQAAFPLNYFLGSLQSLATYGVDESTAVSIQSAGTHFAALEACFIVFLIGTIIVTWRGINRGLEMISWIVIPALFLILLSLAAYMTWQFGLMQSLAGLFNIHPDQSFITVLFAAMGFALFKLNVGMGSMIVYGSYIPYNTSYIRSTLWIVLADILISIFSFLIIYPLMQQSSLESLNNFNVVQIFSTIPGGLLVASLYFFAALIAAWTCTIAMAETVTITFIERLHWTRPCASIVLFIAIALVGTFATLTHTEWAGNLLLNHIPLQGIIKNTVNNWLAPLSALSIAIFVGWIVKNNLSQRELDFPEPIYRLWRLLILLAPIFIILIFVSAFTTVF